MEKKGRKKIKFHAVQLGFSLNEFQVTKVTPGSVAEEKGVRAGWTVIGMDKNDNLSKDDLIRLQDIIKSPYTTVDLTFNTTTTLVAETANAACHPELYSRNITYEEDNIAKWKVVCSLTAYCKKYETELTKSVTMKDYTAAGEIQKKLENSKQLINVLNQLEESVHSKIKECNNVEAELNKWASKEDYVKAAQLQEKSKAQEIELKNAKKKIRFVTTSDNIRIA